jgi:hypothetical protein
MAISSRTQKESIMRNYAETAKPAVWGAVAGAIAVTAVGFWGMGWKTAGAADEVARQRAGSAVVSALVPYCVAHAQKESETAKLTKLAGETSSYTRGQLVADAGWATALGATTPDRPLAEACADKLQSRT